MNIYPFKAAFPKVDLITSPKSFFSNIKFHFREYRQSGFYGDVEFPGYYIYEVHSAHGKHTGLICCTDINDLNDGLLLKHEKTLASKEQQMMHILLQRNALVKPTLLAYHPVTKINKIIKEQKSINQPIVDVTFDQECIRHKVWQISEQTEINKLTKLFAKVPKSYIGDGHHRTSTIALLNQSTELGLKAQKYDQLLTAYFPMSELQILDYNRVMDIEEIMSGTKFMGLLSKYFHIREMSKPTKPSKKHVITMHIEGMWYRMVWKNEFLKSKKNIVPILDSDLLNKYVFGKILGIKDVRIDQRIKYYSGLESLKKIKKQVNNYKVGVGFFITPITLDELTEIADQSQTLPPKSTWFEPRLVSGIIAKDL